MAARNTAAEVCNLALGLVGQRQFIDDLTDASTEAEVCKQYFAQTRNELLQAWHWRFATKRVVLAETTEVRTGWGYCYAAPSDMLKPQRIWDGDRRPGAGEAVPFGWELNDAGSGFLILTDMAEAELIYTVEQAIIGLWSPSFTKAVAAQLAVYLAGALAVKPQLWPALERGAVLALQRAAALDANAGQADPEPDSEIIRERG